MSRRSASTATSAKLARIHDAGLFAGTLPNGSQRYQLRAQIRRQCRRARGPLSLSAGADRFRSLSARRRHPPAALRQARRASAARSTASTASPSWCWRRMRGGSAWSAISISGTRGGIRCGCAATAIGSCSFPHASAGDHYKFDIIGPQGQHLPLKSDPLAFAARGAAEDRLDRVRRGAAAAAARRARRHQCAAARRCRSTRCISARGGARATMNG